MLVSGNGSFGLGSNAFNLAHYAASTMNIGFFFCEFSVLILGTFSLVFQDLFLGSCVSILFQFFSMSIGFCLMLSELGGVFLKLLSVVLLLLDVFVLLLGVLDFFLLASCSFLLVLKLFLGVQGLSLPVFCLVFLVQILSFSGSVLEHGALRVTLKRSGSRKNVRLCVSASQGRSRESV